MITKWKIVLLCTLLTFLGGCATAGIALYYKKAQLPESQIVHNINYSDSPDSDPIKNRLDLYLPEGKNWPTMIFVHGGSWSEGDKDLKVGGADVYANIGRYFASQGIGAAVISYRLQPKVDWKTQVMDVAKATGWVYRHIHEYHGDTRAIFLAGHSAGAQLATRVALDPSFLNSLHLSPQLLCGVIPVSGVGYNFLNEEVYQMGKKEDIYQDLFHMDNLSKKFRKKLSPIFYVKEAAPPFLILYAAKDYKEMKDDSKNLYNSLMKVGARSQIYKIPKTNHKSMVLALSHANKMPPTVMMVFMRTLNCNLRGISHF